MNMIWNGKFTPPAYEDILDYLQEHFPLNYTVGDIPQILSQIFRPKFVIRHDVLQSLDSALEMSTMEQKRGIRTSYMIHADASDISLESPQTQERIERIKQQGHEVGIYIDTGTSRPPRAELEKLLLAEKERFEKNLSFPVLSVVFPTPPQETDPSSFFIAGLINAASDSLSQWSLSDLQGPWLQPEIAPDKNDPERCLLQILIHPHLWK